MQTLRNQPAKRGIALAVTIHRRLLEENAEEATLFASEVVKVFWDKK